MVAALARFLSHVLEYLAVTYIHRAMIWGLLATYTICTYLRSGSDTTNVRPFYAQTVCKDYLQMTQVDRVDENQQNPNI